MQSVRTLLLRVGSLFYEPIRVVSSMLAERYHTENMYAQRLNRRICLD